VVAVVVVAAEAPAVPVPQAASSRN